ncbi:hypothetical protein H7A76_27855 [Pseudomonas sp. MSSRFD41]|uniref:hypothetical protein n=1 Tax=Pseudomonas sp. MSSRFD41 TaxID=1310370 RepID=UPI00163A857F|nr:hypothetical protein [Pseudomonas sp. MSSRFD41]MBC2659272.1 hypothetical protein [Pseudomonas sp. MSSRFD41]
MATAVEKNSFINSIYQLVQGCNAKSNDGGLTLDQRATFLTAVLMFNSRLGSAVNRDFTPIPSGLVNTAVSEMGQAVDAAEAAVDDNSVHVAAKELWDAATAINNALGVNS